MIKKFSGYAVKLLAILVIGVAVFELISNIPVIYNHMTGPQPKGTIFSTLPPSSPLQSEAQCSTRVRRSSWEPRSENYTPNHRVPSPQQIAALTPWGPALGLSAASDTIRKQITGNFVGTTDEILQWVACKWGIDENIVRAEAVVETEWVQNQRGDLTNDRSVCPPDTWDGTSCYQSYGILQIKYTYSHSTWPMSRDDTAFNADYTYAYIRNCFEGGETYLYERTPKPGYQRYHPGDIWGCIGMWFSGSWYDQDALGYIAKVKYALTNEEWLNLAT